ncbi:MAG: TIR domain-containing protein [Alphaproteobacteria bacterium]|nr:TIR domain-containing protein [Rhizobiaceae bacterium]MBU3960016.1 TIR domain-containing protein [Alphaproteobacteria bacterium]MBU4050672.1 TIR domain-containing protein [Alphaproteobacteria bacterium]MBU4089671.1 TIR domain-containing protein [Alphaproteobacteria bacterium]MBU4155393.1 TIR domain-containing protein [Alphaproteobacteria bacterium]
MTVNLAWDDPLLPLRLAHSVQDVASALGLEPGKFFYVVKNADNGRYYKQFQIPKKKGGMRDISKPVRGLALAQDRFAAILLRKYEPKQFVKGYVKGQSFLTNAQYHERQRWVLNIDIKDFFPSIGFARVRGLFLSNYFGFNERVATILARITTFQDGLPQGASTSPVIANIIAHNLDKRLVEIAIKERLRYTRYADDITFSSSQKVIPSSVIKSWEPLNGTRTIVLGNGITDAFRSARFEVNEKKTRILFPSERQEVTGLIVNRKANVWRSDISLLRMKLHSARVHGASKAAKLWLKTSENPIHFWQHIEGWLSYILQVRGPNDAVVAKLCKMAVLSGLKGSEWIERYADMVREFDVFLSHASEDKPKIRKLKDRLELLGLKVFFDESSISWGDSIVDKINHGLLKSSYFVPFLSDTFSIKGWTNKELNSAISLNINRKGRILPICDADFSVEENYPLLNETLYRKWPLAAADEDAFLDSVADEILKKVLLSNAKPTDLSG